MSDEQTACIAMEYVDGPTLSALKACKDANCLEIEELNAALPGTAKGINCYSISAAQIAQRSAMARTASGLFSRRGSEVS